MGSLLKKIEGFQPKKRAEKGVFSKVVLGFLNFGNMFEGYSADTFAGKFLLMLMGGRVEGLACADPGVGTPIGVSGY